MSDSVEAFGLASVYGPAGALVGVFLGPEAPSVDAKPPGLDFSTSAARDQVTLSPLAQQVFYVGRGKTSTGTLKSFIVPIGATRLFLGVLESGACNYDNAGWFSVTIPVPDAPPPPDLTIENVVFSPASVNVGGNFTISFRVRNIGAGPAGATQARLRLSADQVLTRYDRPLSPLDVNIPAMAAGQSYQFTGTVTVPAGTPQGLYYVGVFADWDNRANQSDITNDGGLSATQLTFTAPGAQPPVITSEPQGGTITAGESIRFRRIIDYPTPA